MKTRVAVLALVLMSFVLSASDVWAWTRVREKQLSTLSHDEIEPALISHTVSGVDYHCSVWMNSNPDINAGATFRYNAWTVGGSTTTGTVPAVAPYTRYADPTLVKPPAQNRFYLVGLGINVASQYVTDYAIIVWTSTNWGVTWSAGHVMASSTRNTTPGVPSSGYRFDKPVATAGTGANSKLWVTYVRLATANDGIHVQSGTPSTGTPVTWSWTAPSQVVGSSENPNAPQIMTDTLDGQTRVYVLYTGRMGLADRSIHMRRATGNLTFSTVTTIPNVGDLTTSQLELTPGVTIRTVVVPVARIDRQQRRIMAAWHEVNPAGGMRLQLAVYGTEASAWLSNTTLASGTNVRHVNVGMEFEPLTLGKLLVTWYRFGAQSTLYNCSGKIVTFEPVTHNATLGAEQLVTTRVGDAFKLRADSEGLRHIGEYHDVTFTNGTFNSVHVMTSTSTTNPSDIWAFTVSEP